jgi:hypothetical protein
MIRRLERMALLLLWRLFVWTEERCGCPRCVAEREGQ